MLVHKYDDPTYLQESWILYGIGVFIIFLRFAVRTRTVGLQGFQGDDYLTLVVLACFTSDAVAVRIIQHHGSNVDYSEAEMRAMTAEERDRVSYGSRLQFVCWYTYPTLMWALKGCMLFFVSWMRSRTAPSPAHRTVLTSLSTVQSTHSGPDDAESRQMDGIRVWCYVCRHYHGHVAVVPTIQRELGNPTLSTRYM